MGRGGIQHLRRSAGETATAAAPDQGIGLRGGGGVQHRARMPAPTTAPTLTDGVVTIRAHRLQDVPRIVEQCRDPESVRWTQVPVPYAAADAETFVGELVPQWWAEGTDWAFAVEHEGRFAGTVSLRDEGDGRAELAFGAHPDVRGSGAVERACRLLLEWG